MKNSTNNILLVSGLIFFLIINTTYYWEGKLGVLNLLAILFLLLYFLILLIFFVVQLSVLITEKFKNKNRLLLLTVLFLILGLTLYKPRGLIDFETFEGKTILTAQREGVANCTKTIKLKENRKFTMTDICFGIDRYFGKYYIKNDTIYFDKEIDFEYKFGIINTDKNFNELKLYRNKKDTIPFKIPIIKNDLN